MAQSPNVNGGDELGRLGLQALAPIVGGWQSVAVYSARLGGVAVAVKVFDAAHADREVLDRRVELMVRLAGLHDAVCAPVPIGGRHVHDLGDGRCAVAYEFAEGDAPDIGRVDDAERMGRALAGLHAATAALPLDGLPPLRAFPTGVADRPQQVLHGDFSSKNVRFTADRWRVFDFDDCGTGPVELDVANSVYFVLFDALTSDSPDRYRRFRDGFLAGYGALPDDAVLDDLITRRVQTLASWLDDLTTAPPGIRTADPAWHATLAAFVRRYHDTNLS
jgi:Ser/Thr protein kinase RdoA (MazF antagonist)